MIGKSIANRPYMYLPLKGDTNDYSTNAQNPSNTGVTTTTGQFGESNGAYEWADATDKLAFSSSIGNAIATLISNGATFFAFVNITTLTFGDLSFIYGQYPSTTAQRSFGFLLANDGSITNGTQLTISNGTTLDSFLTNSNLSYATWGALNVVYSKNGSFVDTDLTIFGNNSTDSGSVAIKTNSTSDFTIGARADNNTFGDFGKMHTFRIYNVTLSDGALKILNNEKGRIRA